MKLIVICNPGCGKQKLSKHKDLIVSTLSEKHDVTYVESKSLEDLKALVSDASKEYECIVICGGDGTFHHCMNSLRDFKGYLGYIPAGTSCDMGKNLNTSKNVKKALKVILDGTTKKRKSMHINDLKVSYVLASGKFVATSYQTGRKLKKLGKFVYLFKCIPEIFRRYKLNVKIDGTPYRAKIVCILNSRCVFGCTFRHCDNEVLIIRKHPLLTMARILLTKKVKTTKWMDVISLDGKKLEFDFDTWSVDGEKMILPKEFECNGVYEEFDFIVGK